MPRKNPDQCVIPNCPSIGRLKTGLCPKHYTRKRIYGDPVAPLKRAYGGAVIVCSVSECDRTDMKGGGLCRKHYQQRSQSENREQWAAYTRKRRTVRMGLSLGNYTTESLAMRMAYWGNKCWMCGGPFECVDHVKPLNAGGNDCPANFRPACISCNSSKGAKWFGVSELHRFVKA